jgi:hypothetical protein
MAKNLMRGIIGPDYLKAIGLVAASHARLEHTTHQMVWKMGGLDPIVAGPIVTTELGTRSLLDVLRSYAYHYWPFEKLFFDEYQAAYHEITADRNRIVHAIWIQNIPKGAAMVWNSAKGHVKSTSWPVAAAELRQLAAHISEVNAVGEKVLRAKRASSLRTLVVPRLTLERIQNLKPSKSPRPL